MEADIERMNVKELKDFLRKHGQLVCGKKEELVRRARGTLLLRKDGEDAVDDAVERNDTDSDMKVFILKGWCIPEAVAFADWPDITDKELYNCMVYKCHKSVDMQRKNARRQLKAHVFYDDRHVHSVSYHPVAKDSDQCYLKCMVIPSAASSNTSKYPDRKLWLSASKVTGQIAKAYCDCTAGHEGSCNHVSAFLYALVDITAHKRNELDASTSAQCKWNMPRKRKLSPKKADDFKNKKAKLVSAFSGSGGISLQCLAEKLKSCNPDCGIMINFLAKEMPSEQPKCLPSNPVPDFLFADFVDLKDDSCTTVFTKFAKEQIMTEEDILNFFYLTMIHRNMVFCFHAMKHNILSLMIFMV